MKKMMRLLFLMLPCVCMMPSLGCSRSPQLTPLAADAVILAFGDSLTAGTGANEAESYPAVLAQLTGRRVVNAGIPGEMSDAGVARLPEVMEREKPALLILCHGANDLLRRRDHKAIADNLRAMIVMAKKQGVAVALIAVPSPDLSLAPPTLYSELAVESNIPVEKKVLARIIGKSSLKSDHVHPNSNGYRQMAEAVAALLKKSGALQN